MSTFMKVDEAHLNELIERNSRKCPSHGIITDTLRSMQPGDCWIIPAHIKFASVRATCWQLNNRLGENWNLLACKRGQTFTVTRLPAADPAAI